VREECYGLPPGGLLPRPAKAVSLIKTIVINTAIDRAIPYEVYLCTLCLLVCSPTTSFRPKVRFSALLPALHVLKDAYMRRGSVRWTPTIQATTQIKVTMNRLHSRAASTEGIMHPHSDPFSRARIPYLECIPPRTVKTAAADFAGWEKIGTVVYVPPISLMKTPALDEGLETRTAQGAV
jgi:hypothetical protein